MASAPSWAAARQVLAVRLDNLGDVLMTTPALQAIRQSGAVRHLTLLASPVGAGAVPHLPMVDDAIVYKAPWTPRSDDSARLEAALVVLLARRRFDAAVIFTVCTQSALPAALVCRMAGIPLRLAYCRENPYALLSDWLPETDVCADQMRHEVRRQLDLVAAVGFPASDEHLVFERTPDQDAGLRRKLAQAGIRLQPRYVVVHPGASAASRRYPPERFGQAAELIRMHTGCQIIFCGDAADHGLVEGARQAMVEPAPALVGLLTLGEMACLQAGASLVLCNNSGPAHIAAAVGTPVVVLYALTNVQHTPWQVRARVLNQMVPCRHCLKSTCPAGHHGCLLGVTAEAVAQAALNLLQTGPACSARL